MKNQLSQFLVAVIIVFTLSSCAQSQSGKTVSQKLDANSFKNTLESVNDVQLIDVRTQEEFASGHLVGSINYDIYLNDFDTQLASLNKNQPVMVYCKGGGRSADAIEKLEKLGFTQIYDLSGGIMAWEAKGFPTEGMQGNLAKNDSFTQENFTNLIESEPLLLVDFYAPWCAPCRKMEPILADLAHEFQGKVRIERINVDDARKLCKELQIESLPVVALFKAGKEVHRTIGFQDEAGLRALIAELLK